MDKWALGFQSRSTTSKSYAHNYCVFFFLQKGSLSQVERSACIMAHLGE